MCGLFIESRSRASDVVEMSLAHVREGGVSVVKLDNSLVEVPIIAETLRADEGNMTRSVEMKFPNPNLT